MYRHSQRGFLPITIGAVAIAVATAVVLSAGEPLWPVAVLCALLLPILLVFSKLTIEITETEVVASFGAGWPRKRARLADTEAVEVVRNPWYYGWGIRVTPHGTLYNVAGSGGIEVRLRSGSRFRLGSDEPERLAEVLRTAVHGEA